MHLQKKQLKAAVIYAILFTALKYTKHCMENARQIVNSQLRTFLFVDSDTPGTQDRVSIVISKSINN